MITTFNYWKSNEKTLVDLYYNQNLSTVEIGKYFGVNKSTISNNMNKMGYKLRHVGEERSNCVHYVDVHYFDVIDDEYKAYILGFILADGHISKSGNLMFTLKNDDIDILYKINACMDSNYQIKSTREKYSSLIISSKYLCGRLFDIGFNNRKTYGFDFEKVIENINPTLYHHFIRGMFDGDGSIRYYKYDYNKKHSFHFGYTGLYEVVHFIKDYFDIKTKDIKETNLVYTGTTKNIQKIMEIKNVLYKDAHIFMNRKYETFLEIEKIYEEEFK